MTEPNDIWCRSNAKPLSINLPYNTTMKIDALTSTPLDDPLYYLRNAEQVVRLCLSQYDDLLLQNEVQALERLLSLDLPARALLIRMVMRKGTLFRTDALQYEEVPDLDKEITALADAGLVQAQPRLSLEALCHLSRRDECRALAQQLLPDATFAASSRKTDLVTTLLNAFPDTQLQTVENWWPQAPFQVLELSCSQLFDRLRLMFFGNLYQSLSEFVLTELGLQQFETVPLTDESRPFQNRAEVDLYLQLHQLQQRAAEGEPIEVLCDFLPPEIDCDWIDYRRQKVLFQLGREAERQQQTDLALNLYRQSQHRGAQLRALRIQEKLEPPEQVFQWACEAYTRIPQPEIRVGLQRIQQRCARKAKLEFAVPEALSIPTESVVLPKPAQGRVEQAVIASLSDSDTALFHVENRLFTGLFALLFWPALFAPVRGAFFNPFQSGPADLYRPGFNESRAEWLDEGFEKLQSGTYQQTILQRLDQKRGISCSLIHWPSLTPDLVENALAVIPAAHLDAVFRHLLLDLRHHRRGLPDLIALKRSTGQYRLIEVKGPGDRLQDHQRLWLQAMLQHEMPVSVLNVSWHEHESVS
ncbi:VRR-NUC domain-containing protein [Marinobacterium sp. MBR-109]